MATLPTDSEIRARAEQDSLLAPGADLTPSVRRTIAKVLLAERNRPAPAPAAPEPILLSRTTHPALGGVLRVDVIFTPTVQEG